MEFGTGVSFWRGSDVIAREGFEYKNTILIPSRGNGNVIYSGKIRGKSARFTVSDDKIVEFQYGNKTYGPYTAREDTRAMPKDKALDVRN